MNISNITDFDGIKYIVVRNKLVSSNTSRYDLFIGDNNIVTCHTFDENYSFKNTFRGNIINNEIIWSVLTLRYFSLYDKFIIDQIEKDLFKAIGLIGLL